MLEPLYCESLPNIRLQTSGETVGTGISGPLKAVVPLPNFSLAKGTTLQVRQLHPMVRWRLYESLLETNR